MQRIGVFVCWCGSNIAATVDVERVSQALAKEPGVVFSTNYQYMCSQTGQQMIQEKIHEYGLTGVVICSCSPRMHEQTFRKTCEKAGLNPYMVEIANIREQCSWIHKDKEAGTEKAIILGRAEMYASKHGVVDSAIDGAGMGLGFTLAICAMAAIRETLGCGTFCGLPVPWFHENPIGILTMAPGGFFVFGCMIALINKISKGKAIKKKEFGCAGCPGCGKASCSGKEAAAK